MSKRITPDQTDGQTAAPAGTVEKVAGLAAFLNTPTGDVPAIEAAVTGLSAAQRKALVLAVIGNHSDRAADTATVLAAPTGPSAADTIRDHLNGLVDRLAGFVLAARTADYIGPDSDLPAMVAAALARVQPDEAAVSAALTKASGRTRRYIARDWSAASGTYLTPGRPDQVAVKVSVKAGTPTFSTPDGQTFTNPTAALKHADGWGTAKGGWGNPFVVLVDTKGRTLGERAPERST